MCLTLSLDRVVHRNKAGNVSNRTITTKAPMAKTPFASKNLVQKNALPGIACHVKLPALRTRLPKRRELAPFYSLTRWVRRPGSLAIFAAILRASSRVANVCGSLKMNKFHSYVVFFNGPHCARPEQIYF
jgi:hypothetical protein